MKNIVYFSFLLFDIYLIIHLKKKKKKKNLFFELYYEYIKMLKYVFN